MAANIRAEQRSTLNELNTYLTAKNYMDITYTDGYQPEGAIKVPHVTVTFAPSSPKTLQIGRVAGQDSLYQRSIIINAYMENDGRAQGILGDIMDFLELTCIDIKNHENTYLGYMLCNDTESILGMVLPPIMNNPQNLRWRATATAPFEAFYPDS